MPNILAFGLGNVTGFFAFAFVLVVLYVCGGADND